MTQPDDLSLLWRQASTMPIHGPGCACSTPMSVEVKPESFELDVLDFVTDKHSLSERPGWSQALEAREAMRSEPFIAWLRKTCLATLDEDLQGRVIADVVVVLESRIEHAGRRFTSPAVKDAGWLTTLVAPSSSLTRT